MTKTELIEHIASQNEMTKAAAGRALDSVLEAIEKTLVSGDKLALPGFGTFSTGKRAARTGRNPQTGAEIKIAAAVTVKFTAGKSLKDAVQKQKKKK